MQASRAARAQRSLCTVLRLNVTITSTRIINILLLLACPRCYDSTRRPAWSSSQGARPVWNGGAGGWEPSHEDYPRLNGQLRPATPHTTRAIRHVLPIGYSYCHAHAAHAAHTARATYAAHAAHAVLPMPPVLSFFRSSDPAEALRGLSAVLEHHAWQSTVLTMCI